VIPGILNEEMMKHWQLALIVVMIMGLAASSHGQEANENDYPYRVPEIVVTATHTEKSEFEVPYILEVITDEEISIERMSRTLPDALRQTPGVMVQKSGYGQASPFIRGFTGFRTLLLIDGIRLNNSTYRSGPNQYLATVDPYSIARMEVIKGLGSVLYGSDSIGGTINMITLTPTAMEPSGANLRLLCRHAEAEHSNVYRAQVNGRDGNRLGVYLGGTLKEFGDYQAGQDMGHMPRTGYQERSTDLKIEYAINPGYHVVLAYQRLEQDDVWRTHTTIYSKSWEGTKVGTEKKRALDQSRELFYVQLHATDAGPIADRLKISLSYHLQEEEQERIKSDDTQDEQGVEVKTLGAFINLTRYISSGSITYGGDYYLDEVDSFRKNYNPDGSFDSEAIQGPVGDDSNYEIAGAFVQGEVWLHDRLELYLGGRYSFSRAVAREVEDPVTRQPMRVEDEWEAYVGNARVIYYPDSARTFNIYAGVSQAFRAPNLSDLTRLDAAHESGEVEIPSPGLDSERYIIYEGGVKAWTERMSFQTGYYYTDIEDLIARTPTGKMIGTDMEVTKKNVGNGYVEGVEVSANIALTSSWTAFGAYGSMYGRVDSFPTSEPEREKEYKDRLMPQTGVLGLRWDSADHKYWIEGVATFADKADRLSTRDKADLQRIPPGGTPGYEVYTLRGGADLGRGIKLSAALENLTNEDYRVHGSGQNEPGTNLIISLEWKH